MSRRAAALAAILVTLTIGAPSVADADMLADPTPPAGDGPDPVLVEAIKRAADAALDYITEALHLTRHGEAVVTVADLLAAMRSTSDDDEDAYSRLLARLGLDWESD